MKWSRALIFPVVALLCCAPWSGEAQIDPFKRRLLQFGYNQPVEGKGPIAGYAYYFLNRPGWYRTNMTLRLAVAPVYMDGEIGFKGLLGEHTDLGVGLSGGGFADWHQEVRGGRYRKTESFSGHGGELSASVYHLMNPNDRIPLHAVARVAGHYTDYQADADTASGFVVPDSRGSLRVRSGLRLGGREPLLTPALALEMSAWYEGSFYTGHGPFGFGGDRIANGSVHKFWGRALLAYTFPKRGDYFTATAMVGSSLNTDRLNAYRLGGALPMSSEFPMYLPGYYFGEISAYRFSMIGGHYAFPLDPEKRWTLNTFGNTAWVDYVSGMQQVGSGHSGIGGGLGYRSPKNVWQIIFSYGYGLDAIRNNRRGAHAVGFLLQYDIEALQRLRPTFESGIGPELYRGVNRFIRGLNIFN